MYTNNYSQNNVNFNLKKSFKPVNNLTEIGIVDFRMKTQGKHNMLLQIWQVGITLNILIQHSKHFPQSMYLFLVSYM